MTILILPCPNSTVTHTGDIPDYLGFICAPIAVLCYGSNFVPIKKYETGDGLFFQWILASAALTVGLIVNLIRNSPQFYPLVMLGGALWSTGNLCTVPIVKTIGLGLGILIWGSGNLIFGWVSGRFGLFGLCPEPPHNNALNIAGVSLAALSGCSLAIFAGACYGLSFAPSQYVQDHYKGASYDGLDYVFSQFCGIFLTSTFYFIVYCIYRRNQPRVYPRVILPGLVSGLMWAIATTAWFVANATLSQAVSFPIITAAPGLIASFWGVVVFGEIKGRRNIVLLFCAFAVNIGGAVLSGFSR